MQIIIPTPVNGVCYGCATPGDWLIVQYDWSDSGQADLDTNTKFLGDSAGWNCGNGGKYLTWDSRDNTGYGPEFSRCNVRQSLRDGAWTGQVEIECCAGWFIPAKGTGPAMLSVSFNGETRSKQINPGSQSGCASTVVARITVKEDFTWTLQ